MEITLEKIELVRDRTGVTYKEAKEALESNDGSVVDAIIELESKIDTAHTEKNNGYAAQAVEKIKEAIKKGNVSKIQIRKGEETVLNLPVNLGILGTVIAPWATIAGVIAAIGTKCEIHLLKDNGEVINVSERAGETFDTAVVRGSILKDEVVEKGGDAFDAVKDKAADVMDKASDVFERVKSKGHKSDDWYSGDEYDKYSDGDIVFSDFEEDEDEDSCGCGCTVDDDESDDVCWCGEEYAKESMFDEDEDETEDDLNETAVTDFFDLEWVKKAGGRADNELDQSDDEDEADKEEIDDEEDISERIKKKFEKVTESAEENYNLFKDKYGDVFEDFGEKLQDIGDKTGEKISIAAENFSKGLSRIADNIEEKFESVTEKVEEVTDDLEDKAEDSFEELKERVEELKDKENDDAGKDSGKEDVSSDTEDSSNKKRDIFKLFKF